MKENKNQMRDIPDRWKYGTAWEKHPIEPNEVWEIRNHRIRAGDLMNPRSFDWIVEQAPDFMYVDPPWNQSNISTFFTKAGLKGKAPSFADFLERVVSVAAIVKHDSWIEMGNQSVEMLKDIVKQKGGNIINDWPVTYYKKHPSRIIQVAWTDSKVDSLSLSNMDDEYTPFEVCAALPPNSKIVDICAGKGLTAEAAVRYEHTFIGLELHPRRLAWAIERTS